MAPYGQLTINTRSSSHFDSSKTIVEFHAPLWAEVSFAFGWRPGNVKENTLSMPGKETLTS